MTPMDLTGDDAAQAFARYRKAADQGQADAQNWLGWMYQNGRAFRRTTPRPSPGIARPPTRDPRTRRTISA